MIKARLRWTALMLLLGAFDNSVIQAQPLSTHPLDGLSTAEYRAVKSILTAARKVTAATRFHTIDLQEPPKQEVLAWSGASKGATMPKRMALAVLSEHGATYEAIVDLSAERVVSFKEVKGEPSILLEEVLGVTGLALSDQRMVAGLQKRGLKPDGVFCLPLTAGSFGDPSEAGKRLMKVPCYVRATVANVYTRPVEGLFATVDLRSKKVVDVTDTGVVSVPSEEFGYTEAEVSKKAGPLRPAASGGAWTPAPDRVAIQGSQVHWDIWGFHLRTEKRAGVVVSNVRVKDGDAWREVAYQMHLSEVFVPYMDPDKGWYWRTYMDSGEYGFGIFLSPLKKGSDCPSWANYISITMPQDNGDPVEMRDAVCVFERAPGDPAWRHFEILAEGPNSVTESRVARELVVRSASEVGNYDYLIDYVFQQDGTIRINVGASGIDSVKGATARSMKDHTAAAETRFGTLIAPNLVAPVHSHYFNFRLDLDIDGQANDFMRMKLAPKKTAGLPRKSYYALEEEMPATELAARTRIDASAPSELHFVNPNVESALGHHPGYMLMPSGSYAYTLLDPSDPPVVRNPYVNYQLWVTPYDESERYAGGRYAVMSHGDDTLATWTKRDRPIHDRDIVVWYTMGFHHVPRMEDWPVMPTHWTGFSLMPYNFFSHNPTITIRNEQSEPRP
jgi:primary-amine oxidase